MKTVKLLAGVVSMAGLAVAGAQFNFQPGVSYAVGSQPGGVAAGDLNGDGFNDLATTVDAPDRVEWLANNGDGTFVAGGSVLLPNSSSPGDIVAGDLDGDRDVDLAVALQDFNQVIVILNQGGGAFVTGGTYATGAEPRGMDIGDHDGDGDLDLCVGNRSGNNATVLTNQGNATFNAATLAVGADPRAATFGDWDGDGDLDMAATAHDDRTIAVFTNSGGTFSRTGTLTMNNVRPEGLVGADVNGDGLDDIAAATNDPSFATVYLATGGGSFGGAAMYSTGGSESSSIDAADMNCDGMLDLATGNELSNDVSVLSNNGGGTFGGATRLAAGANPDDVTAADLDGDGVADLVSSNRNSGNLSVFLNDTCGGGGEFTLSLSGACPGAMTATTNNSTPGGFVAFISAFGTGAVVIPQNLPCAGTVLGLNATATLLSTAQANANGVASVSGNAPVAACGAVFLQALDVATCGTSNVEAL